MPRSLYQRIQQPADDGLSKLLGPLEITIMERMWGRGAATVRDIATDLQTTRAVAYTTVMTVMINLAAKGLLTRTPLDKRTHLYAVATTRDAYILAASERVVRALVHDFGDLALTQFAALLEEATPEQRGRIRRRLKERAAREHQAAASAAGEAGHDS
jgi:predicted transcriptional regulator